MSDANQESPVTFVGIIPPFMLDSIIKNGSPEQKAAAIATAAVTESLRANHSLTSVSAGPAGVTPMHKSRSVYTANSTATLPGTLTRSEGQSATGDLATDEAYGGLGSSFDFYGTLFERNSIDDAGMELTATVHYENKYNNASWDDKRKQMLFGDGDGMLFQRFTIAVDVIAHEWTHGVIGCTAKLPYRYQSGALAESIADVFGSLVKQHKLNQLARDADWLIGKGLFVAPVPPDTRDALRSMKAPGTAYNDRVLGKDPQVAHMNDLVRTTLDWGGVHINSGIPNKAFYLLAVALGDYAWEKAGRIWYQSLIDPRLLIWYKKWLIDPRLPDESDAVFEQFAHITAEVAANLFGGDARAAVIAAWNGVGITVGGKVPLYRYWNSKVTDHFYTTNWSELGSGKNGFKYENVQCYVDSEEKPGTVPLFRYWNPTNGDHFYTTSWSELENGKRGWTYESVQCYVYDGEVAGSAPLYRYWNVSSGDHFYTTAWNELEDGKYGWKFESVQCYVSTVSTTMPEISPPLEGIRATKASPSTLRLAPSPLGEVPATFTTTLQS